MPAKLPSEGIEEGRYVHDQIGDHVFFPGPGVGKYSPWFKSLAHSQSKIKTCLKNDDPSRIG
jgi:hypothetical protein